jgi:uncharacterized protein YbbK (DUF523 family)
MKEKIIVSACLAGLNCRYDCANKENLEIVNLVKNGVATPVCPEQLGGLPTPREPAELIDDKVITINGKDVTSEYQNGAAEAFKVLELTGATKAILKSKSPMCGNGTIYDGSYSGKTKNGDGIFAKLLKSKGIEVESKE